jgi:hypothetical protein
MPLVPALDPHRCHLGTELIQGRFRAIHNRINRVKAAVTFFLTSAFFQVLSPWLTRKSSNWTRKPSMAISDIGHSMCAKCRKGRHHDCSGYRGKRHGIHYECFCTACREIARNVSKYTEKVLVNALNQA